MTAAVEWRLIPGFDGAYSASSTGLIRSEPRTVIRPGGFRARLRGKLMKTQLSRNGYPQITIKGKQIRVHRLVLLAFVGPCPEGRQCRHLDGNRTNNRLENLAWGTVAENYQDKVRHGTARFPPPGSTPPQKGEAHGRAKLTDAAVREIRARSAAGALGRDLAAEFGVSPTTISLVLLRRRWSHLP